MFKDHRVRMGLNEWRRIPPGYVELDRHDVIQALDVQQLHSEWYAEYPANGMLIGKHGSGRWFRKADALAEATPTRMEVAMDEATVERAARAMALRSGWDGWDSATTCQHTPNGCEPEEERGYWRDLARAALAEAPLAN